LGEATLGLHSRRHIVSTVMSSLKLIPTSQSGATSSAADVGDFGIAIED
jgi:hypothetical protein